MASISATSNAAGTQLTLRMTGLTASLSGTVVFIVTGNGVNKQVVANKTNTSSSSNYAYATGLSPGLTYSISATCTYSNGTTATASRQATTNDPTPATPSFTVTAEGTSVTITVTSSSRATSWDYFVHAVGETDAGENSTEQTYTKTGLTPGTVYVCNVRARNNYGTAFGTAQNVTTKGVKAYIYNGTTWKLATPYIYNSAWKASEPIIYGGSDWY